MHFQSLYGRKCRSLFGLIEVGESLILGPEIIYEAIKIVRILIDRLKVAYSMQKSYADNRRRDLEFEIGDHVYLKISSMKGVMRYGRKGNLSPWYIVPYEVIQQVGKISDEIKLPSELASVQPVFHVSMLKIYLGDPVSVLVMEDLGVDEKFFDEEVPLDILDRQVKKLRNKEVASIRVLWRNHLVEGATWEAEANMKFHYPPLFIPSG
nr:uncharacterized protein LOC101248640 [Solanum lycopersicum]